MIAGANQSQSGFTTKSVSLRIGETAAKVATGENCCLGRSTRERDESQAGKNQWFGSCVGFFGCDEFGSLATGRGSVLWRVKQI